MIEKRVKMYIVKRFKPTDVFRDEEGFEFGGYPSGSTVYAVINEYGKVLRRKDYFGNWQTHFYSSKKRAQGIADVFNMKEGI